MPPTRVSYDDTKDLTETTGWAIPEGSSFLGPPKGRGCLCRGAWGAQSPPGQSGVPGAKQAEETAPAGGLS